MANISWKSKEQIEREQLAEQRAAQIKVYEDDLQERYAAYTKLLATGAEQAELEECQQEIQLILTELEELYNA
jgi:hypothetical protein